MFHRLAARPLVLTASLFLFTVTGCDADGEGTPPPTDIESGSTGASSSTSAGATTSGAGTTDGDGSSSGSSAAESGTAESSTGAAESSSSGGEDTDATDSTGEAEVGYADLAGEYVEPFPGGMTLHTLSADAWVIDYGTGPISQAVAQIDDEARWVVLEDDTLGTFSRNDWTFDDEGVLRYCTGAFGAESIEAAITAPSSDAGDLDGTGCGGMFPWSALEPAE